MAHTPGPWIWMDETEEIPCPLNDGSTGVSWLGRADFEGNPDDEFVLCGPHECHDWPDNHPYKLKFSEKTANGTMAVMNPADLLLIAAAPELLETLMEWRDWHDDNPTEPNRLIPQALALRIDAAITKAVKG